MDKITKEMESHYDPEDIENMNTMIKAIMDILKDKTQFTIEKIHINGVKQYDNLDVSRLHVIYYIDAPYHVGIHLSSFLNSNVDEWFSFIKFKKIDRVYFSVDSIYSQQFNVTQII